MADAWEAWYVVTPLARLMSEVSPTYGLLSANEADRRNASLDVDAMVAVRPRKGGSNPHGDSRRDGFTGRWANQLPNTPVGWLPGVEPGPRRALEVPACSAN